jgi:hypothetical protein
MNNEAPANNKFVFYIIFKLQRKLMVFSNRISIHLNTTFSMKWVLSPRHGQMRAEETASVCRGFLQILEIKPKSSDPPVGGFVWG